MTWDLVDTIMQAHTQTQTQEQMQIEAVRALASEIPLNDFGLPIGIYRTDLLPFHDYKPDARDSYAPHALQSSASGASGVIDLIDISALGDQQGLNSPTTPVTFELTELAEVGVYRIAGFPAKDLSLAFIPLQYDEGFPAFDSGLPFWNRLDFEPSDAYAAFQEYLRMPLGTTGDPEDDEYAGTSASGTRSLSTLVVSLEGNDSHVISAIARYQEYYHLYYWGMRAHAYDLFRVAQYRKQQELRAIETQDEHYVQSRRLRHRLMKYMDDEENFWDLMTPKIGLDMLKTITQLERISAGIPAAGPMSEEDRERAGNPFEVVLRTVAQSNRRKETTLITDDGQVLDNALKDPAATEILQELIIRSGGR
jgi:hypothetical protein